MKRMFLGIVLIVLAASTANAQLTLPYNNTCVNNSGDCFGIINNSTNANGSGIFAAGNGGVGINVSSTNNSAIQAISTNGSGLYVTSTNNNAITANTSAGSRQAIAAQNLSSASGATVIWGWAPNSTNSTGLSMTASWAVVGIGTIRGTSGSTTAGGVGAEGISSGNGYGVLGYNRDPSGAGVRSDGNLVLVNGTFQNQSDARAKHDISDLTSPSGLTATMKLRPVSFLLNAQPESGRHIGFIAQDVQKVLPSIVHADQKDGMLSVAYLEVIPVLTRSIQEQQHQISTLEARVAMLESGRRPVATNMSYGALALLPLGLGGFVFASRKRRQQS